MAKLTKDISLVNPTDLVNDQNANAASSEIQGNIEYILNYLNGNKALLSGIFGNLWDYNADGKRILSNGGKFDTYKKCNTWKSLSSFAVSNDTEITFDSIGEKCVYLGISEDTVNREKWIERDIWIPEVLRDQQLVFSIKAAGSTGASEWATSNSVFETIAIQILGGEEDVNAFRTVGSWDNHAYFSNDSYSPSMITANVPFRTNKSTTSVKVKIFRTVSEGYLHIDKVYVGGIALPYDNEIETYDFNNVDINELFDYTNGVTKVISTGVMGHKVPEKFEKAKGADLVTFENLALYLRSWILASSTGCNITTLFGQKETDTVNQIYTISDIGIESNDAPVITLQMPNVPSTLDTELGTAFTVVATGTSATSGYDITIIDEGCATVTEVIDALTKSVSGDCEFCLTCQVEDVSGYKTFECGYWKDIISNPLRVTGVFNVQDGQFQVALSSIPAVEGYKINWAINRVNIECGTDGTTGTATSGTSGQVDTLGNYFSPLAAISSLTVPLSSDQPTPTIYPDIFGYESDFE